MDADFILSYKTMYDERSYRAPSEYEDEDEQNDEEPEYIPAWEMDY